jgi:hypothetical protein
MARLLTINPCPFNRKECYSLAALDTVGYTPENPCTSQESVTPMSKVTRILSAIEQAPAADPGFSGARDSRCYAHSPVIPEGSNPRNLRMRPTGLNCYVVSPAIALLQRLTLKLRMQVSATLFCRLFAPTSFKSSERELQ